MASLSTTVYGQEWLRNFDEDDQKVASLLLDRLVLVSASEFILGITKQLNEFVKNAQEGNYTVAFYAEREVDKIEGEVESFFPNTQNGRATGSGVQPVLVNPEKQDVGSEGIIATLISKFCKGYPETAFSHPGPDLLRNKKIRKIVLVTDFIGSGQRIYNMFESFGKVASLQSWKSYHLLEFGAACYSCTEWGLEIVKKNSLRPEVRAHVACPVIDEAFAGAELGAIKLLCKKYPKNKAKFPFGFNNTGSLIVFSHGIPNNAPKLLHSSAAGWRPLFVGRSTTSADLDRIADTSDILIKNSEKILGIRNARRLLSDSKSKLWVEVMLILNAVKKRNNTSIKISSCTQLPISNVEELVKLSKQAGWLTAKTSLTALGRRELRLRSMMQPIVDTLAFQANELYFPKQLRAP